MLAVFSHPYHHYNAQYSHFFFYLEKRLLISTKIVFVMYKYLTNDYCVGYYFWSNFIVLNKIILNTHLIIAIFCSIFRHFNKNMLHFVHFVVQFRHFNKIIIVLLLLCCLETKRQQMLHLPISPTLPSYIVKSTRS